MEGTYRKYKGFSFVAVLLVLSLVALAGPAGAEDCAVPQKSATVGDAVVSASDLAAIRAGIGEWGAGSPAHARTESAVDVGLSQVAAADFEAIRDIVAGDASFVASSGESRRSRSVSVGLVQIDRDDFAHVKDGMGKTADAPSPKGCA